jgi:cobalt-precorrin-5B (C1)-methyltransferase
MPQKKKLKTGFTTGTAAAAAAKGALSMLLNKKALSRVKIDFLSEGSILIPLHTCVREHASAAVCTVIKDAGDDPDITHKAVIGARVTVDHNPETQKHGEIRITGGIGVGIVTKPGLEVAKGQPAINSGPRKMITAAVKDVLKEYNCDLSVNVEVFVPEGEKLAKKTLNKRLGILGGISILGTTGIVKPMSHEAYTATIQSAISVAVAMGQKQVVLTTGRRSEKHAQSYLVDLPEEAFIQIGDFFKMSLEEAANKGIEIITLAVFFGKALKQAQGVEHTHASKSTLTLNKLSEWALKITKNDALSQKILSANTARHAFDFINGIYPEIIEHVGRLMIVSAKAFAGSRAHIQSIIFDYNGRLIFDSDTQQEM